MIVENDYKDAIGHKWMKYEHINNHIKLEWTLIYGQNLVKS
jgi:hypothetical protein